MNRSSDIECCTQKVRFICLNSYITWYVKLKAMNSTISNVFILLTIYSHLYLLTDKALKCLIDLFYYVRVLLLHIFNGIIYFYCNWEKDDKTIILQNTYTPCVDTSNVNGSPILGIRGPFVGLHDVVPLTCTVFYQCHQNGLFERIRKWQNFYPIFSIDSHV